MLSKLVTMLEMVLSTSAILNTAMFGDEDDGWMRRMSGSPKAKA
jgi:hypothetical protein